METSVEGARIVCDEDGAGPALLLVHAGIADRSTWTEQRDAFAAGRRVVRPDLRGSGDSALPAGPFGRHEDVRALMDALGIERAAGAGVSKGGDAADHGLAGRAAHEAAQHVVQDAAVRRPSGAGAIDAAHPLPERPGETGKP